MTTYMRLRTQEERYAAGRAEFRTLTEAELDVLQWMGQGFSAAYASRQLVISKRTVEVHVRHIYKKLGIHSRDELIELFHYSSMPRPHRVRASASAYS